MDIGIERMVEMNPVIAAPIPAICPIGSIAMDLIFPQINPKHKNNSERNINKTVMLGSLEPKNNKVYNKAIEVNATKAANDKFRIPKRSTKVPFIKVENPTESANPANT